MKYVASAIIGILVMIQPSIAATVTGDNLNINIPPYTNTISYTSSSVAGGGAHTIATEYGFIGGGAVNKILLGATNTSNRDVFIGGGFGNIAQGHRLSLVGGNLNSILDALPNSSNMLSTNFPASYSSLGGGYENKILGSAFSVIGGGHTNIIDTWCDNSVISGGLSNRVNFGSGYSTISGGGQNCIMAQAWWATINGGQANAIKGLEPSLTNNSPTLYFPEPNSNTINDRRHFGWIGGGLSNSIGGYGIFGGIAAGIGNRLDARFGIISGGVDNIIKTNNGVTIDHGASVIAGGKSNQIEEGGNWNVIGGGAFNKVVANVQGGMILGGYGNIVGTNANYGMALGTFANPIHPTSFVWSDASSGNLFASSTNNSFNVRSYGGARFVSGNGPSGVSLASGGGSWASLSDRNSKHGFSLVDTRAILKKVATIPIGTWSYKAQDPSIKHIGPVAQDFKLAFDVGENDTTITTVDADGVAFAAIQALNSLLDEKSETIIAQQRQLDLQSQELKAQTEVLKQLISRMDSLERNSRL